MFAAGLPAKQAVLLQSSGTTVTAPSKDHAFAAPERSLSVVRADVEVGLSSEQTDESGGPEGRVGCPATKAAGRLSLKPRNSFSAYNALQQFSRLHWNFI